MNDQSTISILCDGGIEGIHKIMSSDCNFPLNLGSERMISINDLVKLIAGRAKKILK